MNKMRSLLLASAFNVCVAQSAFADAFTATQITYSDPVQGNAVLLEWTQVAAAEVDLFRGATLLSTQNGVAGANSYLDEGVSAETHNYSAEETGGQDLGSQSQDVIAERDTDGFFNDVSVFSCAQSTGEDCEIIIDVTTGVPLGDTYQVFIDGVLQHQFDGFFEGSLTSENLNAGERCATVYAFRNSLEFAGPNGERGRYRGNAVETCCDIECPGSPGSSFIRGDVNNEGAVDISDAVYLLANLFNGGPAPPCEEAAFINDTPGSPEADKDISDAIFILGTLFTGGPTPEGWIDSSGDDVPDPTCEFAPTASCLTANEICTP